MSGLGWIYEYNNLKKAPTEYIRLLKGDNITISDY